jgi:hypothetical protein
LFYPIFAEDRFAVCGGDEGEWDNPTKLALVSQEGYSLRLRWDSAIPLRRDALPKAGTTGISPWGSIRGEIWKYFDGWLVLLGSSGGLLNYKKEPM